MAMNYYESLRSAGASISEGADIVLSIHAYVALDSFNKVLEGGKLSIQDVASPFPLLNPGNTYILFITPTGDKSGIIISDLVYGPYMFFVKDGKVYSFEHVSYPVTLDPVRFYENAHEIAWWNNELY